MTSYVGTRWYRAPELLLQSGDYDFKVDIFALGCILAEMFKLTPLFPGNNSLHQLQLLCEVMGKPSVDVWPEGHLLATKMGIQFTQP